MPQTVDIRVERAAGLAEKHQAAAARHRQAAERATARGNTAKAQQEQSLAERSERLAQEHTRFAERNTAGASRARAARSVNAAEILKRAEEAAATPDPTPLTPKQERAEAKRALMLERADAARTKDLRNAGVEADPRTAAGQRELVTSSARGVSGKRASLSGYGSLIQNPADRTGPRLKAMEVFDELCHRAFAGLLPEPRFERGVDVSKTLAGVADSRADALLEMSKLATRSVTSARPFSSFGSSSAVGTPPCGTWEWATSAPSPRSSSRPWMGSPGTTGSPPPIERSRR